ncbi:MAG: SagB/ThcOx family dehydrogenase [Desulfomonile tiedjei]|uniref:SagB/ThcOx family dehydrogenase n=1 Tax=Desulfomonile tiedjei TaxID=2358 RepID=A0A9D6V0A4_9BACT|nr:SagB/ThcOx family dehydrogenase [Desulfomonile tiedjei]
MPAYGEDMKAIQLPEPKLDQSKSLAQALKDRKTTREYSQGSLPQQTLSNLLWTAWGINRPDSGRRTAPSALNRQEIDVYVTMAGGTYIYDPKGHALVPVVTDDLRTLTGTQSYFKDAAVNLVYVADLKKMGDTEEAAKLILAAMDTGFIAENAYLCCAVEGLATVFRVSIDKPKLGAAMKLRPDQRIMGAQTVGLPKAK